MPGPQPSENDQQPDEQARAKPNSPDTGDDEALLKQIRDDFRYVREYWRENREESYKDMDVVACIPPTEFKTDRKGRPVIWPDETSQFVKQTNNNLRQNPRSIKISPRSEEATDKDAEHRQAYIRGIEYASNAKAIYTTACESATECAFGFFRINTRVTGPNGEQEPRIVRIPNWSTVYPDPDALEADFSDAAIYFVLDSMRESVYARRYKTAKKRSFTQADRAAAPEWFGNGQIIVAEYWTRTAIEGSDGEKKYKVTQRITNGVEILETNDWIGSWIPIIGVFGEEIYVQSGGQSKRMFLSLIRRARGSQTMLAYIASQEAEEFQMAPRAPLQGYKGQFDSELHANVHKVPHAYLEFKVPDDWKDNWGPPPLPGRVQFSPNTQAFEMAYERYRRSIQSAMGITPLPTAAQRQNEKSGIALEKIQSQEAIGSYHITDNFVRALSFGGRQIDELITKLADLDSLPKQLLGKDQKNEDVKLRVVPRAKSAEIAQQIEQQRAAAAQNPDSQHLPDSDYFFAHRGQFEVTVADGPSYDSQREAADDFADTIFKTIEPIAQLLPPGSVPKILSIAVKLKNIGALGDEMVDILNPQDQSASQLQQAQQQMAELQQHAAEMQQELQQLKLEKAGKVIDNEYKMQIQQLKGQFEAKIAQLDADLKAYIANVQTKAQSATERDKLFQETQIENQHAAHDIAKQKDQQGHDKEMADKAAATQQAAQAADQVHQVTMAAQEPDDEGEPE